MPCPTRVLGLLGREVDVGEFDDHLQAFLSKVPLEINKVLWPKCWRWCEGPRFRLNSCLIFFQPVEKVIHLLIRITIFVPASWRSHSLRDIIFVHIVFDSIVFNALIIPQEGLTVLHFQRS